MLTVRFFSIFLLTFLLSSSKISAQVFQYNNWCQSQCDAAGDEKENTKSIFMKRNIMSRSLTTEEFTSKKFSLMIYIVNSRGDISSAEKQRIRTTIDYLNIAFSKTLISFDIKSINAIASDLFIDDLMTQDYQPYLNFSATHDSPDHISIYIFDIGRDLCTTTENSIRCGRTGGFSFILSGITNNIVLSKFDLEDHKILAHEMGHFFGLYHTFEEQQFGKDDFEGDCGVLGDCLCDTPPDPGPAYEVYVNYSLCEMIDHKYNKIHDYKPMLNNFMSYYKPCYLQQYEFTQGQIEVLNIAANSDLRSKFSKN